MYTIQRKAYNKTIGSSYKWSDDWQLDNEIDEYTDIVIELLLDKLEKQLTEIDIQITKTPLDMIFRIMYLEHQKKAKKEVIDSIKKEFGFFYY